MLRSLPLIALTVLTTICWAGSTDVAAAEAGKSSGSWLGELTLKDYRGREYSQSDFSDADFTVGIFLGTECPLAKLYSTRLAALAEKYAARGVAFVGFNANQQDSITEIASHARRHGLKFPVLKDLGNRLADSVGATRTPEVIVWDAKGEVRYRGRVDDQYGVGYVRDEPTREDLAVALDELLAGQPVTTPETEPVGCLIGKVRVPDETSPITYSNQIARIFQRRCVECHREGEIAPFTLNDYDDVVGWAEMIAEVVDQGRMPPWHADSERGHFSNDRRLTDEERQQIRQWARLGAPEGDPQQLPEPRTFIVGSQLPVPADLELWMRDEPFVVKAEGEVAYQNFRVDPGFTEDKWITMAEALPGNRSVVHHIVIFVRPPKNTETRGFGRGLQFLTTYVPGYVARPLPAGMAKFVPAGSQLIFQMHYTPIGTEQTDRSRLRLVFSDRDDVEQMVFSSAVQIPKNELVIPPHADNHRSLARGKIPFKNSRLLSLFPHMHLRGKSFQIAAKYADGRQETLLDVPNYDFNWQTTYRLDQAKHLPRGTELILVGHHDNSLSNPANPDPNSEVHWGDQTWEEMFIALFEWSTPLLKEATTR